MKLYSGEEVHYLKPRVAVFPFPADFPRPAIVTNVANFKEERTLIVLLNDTHIVAIGVLPGVMKTAEGGRYRMGVRFGSVDALFKMERHPQIYPHIVGRTLTGIRAERDGVGVVMEFSGGKLVLVNKYRVVVAE